MNKETEVLCFGEPLIGFFTENLSEGQSLFKAALGGDSSNVALAVKKLGHPSGYTTKIGKDIFAEKIQKNWEKEGIDTLNVFVDDAHQTGIYFAIFQPNGKHDFIYKRKNSASANYTIEDAKKVSLNQTKVFHLSGISQAISKSCLEASFYLMRKCKKKGIKISYDLNYRNALWSEDYFNSIAWHTIKHFANLLCLTIDEAALIGLKEEPEKIAEIILNEGPEYVAVKLGKKGCVFGSSDGIERCRTFNIKTIDTTGAGDASTAAIIVGLLEKMKNKQIVYFANAVASMVCEAIGSTEGQPTREEVEKFMATEKLYTD
jgi:2-dehydro-3-deoxygluconokinase